MAVLVCFNMKVDEALTTGILLNTLHILLTTGILLNTLHIALTTGILYY